MKIEQGIPIPDVNKYQFHKMKVGDSILVPVVGRIAAYNFAKRHNVKFTTRTQEDGQVRIWRVK